MAALAGESQQILVIALFTLDAGKAKMRIPALYVLADHTLTKKRQ